MGFSGCSALVPLIMKDCTMNETQLLKTVLGIPTKSNNVVLY